MLFNSKCGGKRSPTYQLRAQFSTLQNWRKLLMRRIRFIAGGSYICIEFNEVYMMGVSAPIVSPVGQNVKLNKRLK